jgi:hypothetical protein
VTKPLPRYVIAKRLASGDTAFYFNVPTAYRDLGCTIPNEPLGTDFTVACGPDGNGGRAAALNGLFDEWIAARRTGVATSSGITRFGTVDWLFREYKRSNAYLEKVSLRSRPDYERTMQLVSDLVTKKGDKVGDRKIKAITPVSADKIYNLIVDGPNGPRPRQGEKVVGICARAWKVVHRLYPDLFDRDVPNPWRGVTKKRRVKATKPAATREQVYRFAWGCIEAGHPEPAAAAVICFEWLQRPENVLGGYIRWSDYRPPDNPTIIRIVHHKTGAVVLHPLQDSDGTAFYAEAEAVLSKLPHRAVSMIARDVASGGTKPYSNGGMEKVIHRMRDALGLPKTFTLDACRHGGMTELEEAELTDGQGRALSAHKSRAYEGYAKRTYERALAATRKRHAHTLANAAQNAARTDIQNDGQNRIQNEKREDRPAVSKSMLFKD